MRGGSPHSSARRQPCLGRAAAANFTAIWRTVLLVALLAFSWQSFVTQTHVHFGTDLHVAALSGQTSSSAHSGTGKGSSDTPGNCPICDEISHDGFYLLPVLAEIEAPELVRFWQAVSAPLARTVRKRSHVWRSRAPPISLQA